MGGSLSPHSSTAQNEEILIMAKIIQFMHPVPERPPSRLSGRLVPDSNPGYYHCRWAEETHARKFLSVPGRYYDDAMKQESPMQDLRVWCEAEWDTSARKLGPTSEAAPRWEHSFLSTSPKLPADGLNTDPYIFGKQFVYTNCRQDTHPSLQKLNAGDMILFGSLKHLNGEKRFSFLLDTVFIVSPESTFLDDLPSAPFKSCLSDWYHQAVLAPLRSPCSPNKKSCVRYDYNYRLYLGASFQKPFDGMFSFAPIRLENSYPRMVLNSLSISSLDCIKRDLMPQTPFCATEVSDVKPYWKQLMQECKRQGYVPGTFFEEP